MTDISFTPNSSPFSSQRKMGAIVDRMLKKSPMNGSDAIQMANRLSSESRVSHAGAVNGEMHLSRSRQAQSALGQMSGIVERLGTLSARASDGMLTDRDREALMTEAESLMGELGDIVGNAKINGSPILQGDQQTAQIDGQTNYQDPDGQPVLDDLAGLDLTTASNADNAMAQVKAAAGSLAEANATAGANEGSLSRAIATAQNKSANMEAAASSIRQGDVVAQVAAFGTLKSQNAAEIHVFKQGQEQVKSVMRLLEP